MFTKEYLSSFTHEVAGLVGRLNSVAHDFNELEDLEEYEVDEARTDLDSTVKETNLLMDRFRSTLSGERAQHTEELSIDEIVSKTIDSIEVLHRCIIIDYKKSSNDWRVAILKVQALLLPIIYLSTHVEKGMYLDEQNVKISSDEKNVLRFEFTNLENHQLITDYKKSETRPKDSSKFLFELKTLHYTLVNFEEIGVKLLSGNDWIELRFAD